MATNVSSVPNTADIPAVSTVVMAIALDQTASLPDATNAIVKATQPVLEQHALAVAARLYERLFACHPDIAALFTGDPLVHEQRFADVILTYVEFIDDIDALEPVVREIAGKHVAAGVTGVQYDLIGEMLLASMVDVLGLLDAAVLDAWADAYSYLASVFKNAEAHVRENA